VPSRNECPVTALVSRVRYGSTHRNPEVGAVVRHAMRLTLPEGCSAAAPLAAARHIFPIYRLLGLVHTGCSNPLSEATRMATEHPSPRIDFSGLSDAERILLAAELLDIAHSPSKQTEAEAGTVRDEPPGAR